LARVNFVERVACLFIGPWSWEYWGLPSRM